MAPATMDDEGAFICLMSSSARASVMGGSSAGAALVRQLYKARVLQAALQRSLDYPVSLLTQALPGLRAAQSAPEDVLATLLKAHIVFQGEVQASSFDEIDSLLI
eukprot:CAMPEP_0181453984 /NCGR_PEP_ID=MMETSP1110-20121109/30005_1 /TAXON_ID=174948 /ORGANISM="Symbiodinium sp., Strain CCMP421" /LENGTH=104 /DNA_ID=CAMNT_0023578317 /DNA_START=111 /DNA_END=427 /DNA_ORIENTATION=+